MADSQPGRSGVRHCEVCRKHKGCGEFSVYNNVCSVCLKWFVKEVDGYYRHPEKVFCTVNGGRPCSIIPSCPLCRLQKFFEVTKHSMLLKPCFFCKTKTVLEGRKPKCSSCIKLLKKYYKMSDEQKQELICSCYSGKSRKCSSCLLVTLLNDSDRMNPVHDSDSEVETLKKETTCFQDNTDTEQSSTIDVEIATYQDESEFLRIDLECIPKVYHDRAKAQLSNECEVVVTKIPLKEILKAIKLPSTAAVSQSNYGKSKEIEVPKKKKKRQRNSSSPLIGTSSAFSVSNKKSEEEDSRHYNILNVNGTRLTLQKSTSAVSSKKTTKCQYVDGILRSAKIHQGASNDVSTEQKKVALSSSIPSSSTQNEKKAVAAKRKHSKESSKSANKSTQTDTTPGWNDIVLRNSDLEKQLAEMRSRLKSNNMHEKLPSLTTPPKSENGEELLTNSGGKQKERGSKDESYHPSTSHSHGVRRDSSPSEERRVFKRARLASTSSSSSAASGSSVSECHSSNMAQPSMQNLNDALDYEDDDTSQPTRQEDGYASNDSDEPKKQIKEKIKNKKHREEKIEKEKVVFKDSREIQNQSKIGLKENDQTLARKSMAKFRIPKRTTAESIVVFPPGSVGLPPLLQQNLEQVLKPSKPAIETETIKTSRTSDDFRHSALQNRAMFGSSTVAREPFSRVIQNTGDQLSALASHERDQQRSAEPAPQLTRENVTSSLCKITPIMNELQYLPQSCRPLPSVVGIRSLHPPKVSISKIHPPKVPVVNNHLPMVSINSNSPDVREQRTNIRFFRLNRDQSHSSEEDSSDEEESTTVCSTRSSDTPIRNDVDEGSSQINTDLPHSLGYQSDAISCQPNSSDEGRVTTKPFIVPANQDETSRSVISESGSDDSCSSDSDSSKTVAAVSPNRDISSREIAATKSSAALKAAAETRTEVAVEEEEADEDDVLDLGLGEDEDFFVYQEEETAKESKISTSSTQQRKTPLQTAISTSPVPRTPAVQIVSPAVRAIDRPSSTLNNKVTSLPLNKSIFGSPVHHQHNSLRDEAITRGLCLELLSKGKCWYKERCPLIHDLNGQLIEYVINTMCECGELEKARHLLNATASPLSSFCHWLITTQQGQGVIEKVIDSHLECPNTIKRPILVEKAIEVIVDINPDIPINPKLAEKAIFAAHTTVSTAKLIVRLYERFESHRIQLSMKCWDKITCVLAELRNREHTLMAVSAAQKQHPEYSASVRVMDFLLASSLEDEMKVVQVCTLFKNYSESSLRVLPRHGMMNLLEALDRFGKPMIFKHFASKFGLHLLPRCELNTTPIQSAINCVPLNNNVASLSQTTSIHPMVVLPSMPRKVAPQLFNRVNATTRSSSSDLSDGRVSPLNEVSHVPIIPLSPVNKLSFPLVPISIPKPQQPLDSQMFSARPREDQKQSVTPTPLNISIPKPQQLLNSQMLSAPPREDLKQSLVPTSLSISIQKPQQPHDSHMSSVRSQEEQSVVPTSLSIDNKPTSHEEPTVKIQSSTDVSVDRSLPVDHDVEQKLRKMMEQGNFGAVTKLLMDLYEHENDPQVRDAIIDCFLLAIKSVNVPNTDIYLTDIVTRSKFLSVGDIVVLILSEACIEGPPDMLPPSQRQAIEDLALKTLHYLTTINDKLISRKTNQRNQEIAHEFLSSLFSFQFNIPELLKHDLSLLLFSVEHIILQNEEAFNSDDVIFMVNLLIAYHKEIIRDSSKLNRALVDEEYSLSNQIVHIASSLMEGEDNCDLNAIASIMEEFKDVSLSNKTVNDMVKLMPYD